MTTHTIRGPTYEAAVGGPIIGPVSESDPDDVEMTYPTAQSQLRAARERFTGACEIPGFRWTEFATGRSSFQIRSAS